MQTVVAQQPPRISVVGAPRATRLADRHRYVLHFLKLVRVVGNVKVPTQAQVSAKLLRRAPPAEAVAEGTPLP